MRTRSLLIAFSLSTTLLLALPAGADWLVTTEGARVETKGPWKIKGKQVIFTLPNGTLSALRLSEVDLDASAVATTEAKRAAEKAAEPKAEPKARKEKPEPVMVVTDKDIRKASDAPEPSGDGEEDAEEGGGPSPAADQGDVPNVAVQNWQSRESPRGGGLELFGTLRNQGSGLASGIELTVNIVSAEGDPLFDTAAFVQSPNLSPGETTAFRVLLPGISELQADPRFEVRSRIGSSSSTPPPRRNDGESDS